MQVEIWGREVKVSERLRGRSPPLCRYPKHAHYNGQGDTEDANNFDCR